MTAYIDLNPVRTGITDDPGDYRRTPGRGHSDSASRRALAPTRGAGLVPSGSRRLRRLANRLDPTRGPEQDACPHSLICEGTA